MEEQEIRKLWVAISENPAASFLWRIIKRTYQEFRRNQCTREANAMAYRTLFSAVPLLAIFLTIFTAFGAFDKFRNQALNFISTYLVPSAKDQIIENMVAMAENVRTLSGISIVATLIVALYLFNAIEMTFNRIWGVTEERSFIRKFTAFTAILLWAPVFLGVSFYLTGLIQAHLPWLSETKELSFISHVFLRAIPVFFTWAALTIIFIVVPNTTVGLGSSAVGALFASVGWEAVKVGFNYYVIYAVNFSKIYGSLSVIPIFIMGIYLLWVVVFAGAEITYVIDNYRYYEEWTENEEAGFKPFLAIGVMLEICGRFYYGEKPPRLNDFAKRFRVSLPLVREVINGLIRGGLVAKIGTDAFQPAKDLHLLTVEEVVDSTIEKCAVIKRNGSAVRRIMQLMHPESAEKLEEVLSAIENEHHIKLGGLTLLELMRLKGKKEEPRGAV